MQIKFILINACAVGICFASCGRGIVNDAPVKLVYPQKELSLTADPAQNSHFEECQQIYQMNVVSDSILVCGEQLAHEGDCMFKAYSCNTLQYLGPFIRKGRADGEMLHPRIVSMNNADEDLFIKDMSLNLNASVDVEASAGRPLPSLRIYSSPSEGVWDWLPLSDSLYFVGKLDKNDELLYKVLDNKDNDANLFRPYRGIDCMVNATLLSELLLGNRKRMKVAQVMMYFPQINIFDIEKGDIASYAVDRRYMQWKSVLNRIMSMDTMTSYHGATASPDFIFASYAPMKLSQIVFQECHGSSIHVFDWDGNWLYNIKVNESIDAMAYDGVHKFLYAFDKAESQIVRYNLDGLL